MLTVESPFIVEDDQRSSANEHSGRDQQSQIAPATGARATAASPAVVCSAGSNAVRPTADTSNLPKVEPIIGTAKGSTVSGSSKPA